MSFTYCQSCGAKNLYSLHPPKFCGSCGVVLGSASVTRPAPVRKQEVQIVDPPERDDDDPDGTDVFSVPSISKLKCSYSAEAPNSRKISFKDLVPEMEELIPEDLPDEKPKKRKRGRPRKRK